MSETHPWSWIVTGAQPRVVGATLLLAAVLMAVLQLLDAPLKTTAAPAGIVSYELAGTAPAAQAILQSWDAQARVYAGVSLGLDYLFIPAYATAIGLGCVIVARGLRLGIRARRVGRLLAWGMVLAALADALENGALLRLLLSAEASAPWPSVARAAALTKFALLGAGLVYAGGVGLRLRAPHR